MAKGKKHETHEHEAQESLPENEIEAPDQEESRESEAPIPVAAAEIKPEPEVPPTSMPPIRQGAGLEEPKLPNGWRPIDSAPRDGSQIEVAVDVHGKAETAYWRKTRSMSQFRWKEEGKWTNPLNNSNIDFFPTVWRPLPKDWGKAVAAEKAAAERTNGGSEAA